MVWFSELENSRIPQLNDAVRDEIGRLRRLTAVFLAGQKDLEGNDDGSVSRFIPHVLGIQKKLDELREDEPGVVCAVHNSIGEASRGLREGVELIHSDDFPSSLSAVASRSNMF
jgi:hypothetical protein